jgi:RNA-directed DNA polymerase
VIRRYAPGWHIASQGRELFRAWQVPVTRYQYRGNRIPTPWGMPTG